ncbi:hypothetical protein MN032_18600 [Agromyces atrinae]|uniref:hypothetical protein n=1 Tax=Agromyces atrinae TaxID=592376 RepID=UPI001F5908E8|nr:hypothetical protein [Agromyces atrinae]MCI2959696.1 hypothetical protein [Agromyces atrinae]
MSPIEISRFTDVTDSQMPTPTAPERGHEHVLRRVPPVPAEEADEDRHGDHRASEAGQNVEGEEPQGGATHAPGVHPVAPHEPAGHVDEGEPHPAGVVMEERGGHMVGDRDEGADPRPEDDGGDGRSRHVEVQGNTERRDETVRRCC